ncbi:gliding motility-associated peptidyl-prolyl isomerase GldI [Psychroflexus lacisalsi]|jgi:gliding motility-associated peptidyl-prolyl isomerase|uniref:Peptidyl-prolyl cis-trans isomerase n=1 Tax=Psychroflexus lacisalsi TaxID=503928 RepID=A0ABP3VIX6_9FLAO|nr:gliding motility-associated peptidyl-prolyl isomerase GldI [Psychroflexus lacisalsi]MBZ9619349.1 gliding motility-associated peptidyl-prolyl isomerase GldI [Psychroflexus lacisalsi]
MKSIIYLVFLIVSVQACKSPEPRKPVSRASKSFTSKSLVMNKAIVEKEEAYIQDIIEKDSTNTYITSADGFWYYYNSENKKDSITPNFGDEVEFNYNILTLQGDTIYSRKELGERAYVIDKEEIFTGLRQGLKLMKEGETVTFLFPSHQAYGYYGDNDKIGTHVALKSTVTLNEIKINKD